MSRINFAFIAIFLFSLPLCAQEQVNTADGMEFAFVKDTAFVRIEKNWFMLKADFTYPKGSETLQREFSKYLFNNESPSLLDAYRDHFSKYDEKQESKASYYEGQYINLNVKCQSFLPGKFLNMEVSYTRQLLEKKNVRKAERSRNYIYDIMRNRLLTLRDVFTPERANEIERKMGDSLTYSLATNEEKLILSYLKKSKDNKTLKKPLRTETYIFKEYPELLCDSFKLLVGFNSPSNVDLFAEMYGEGSDTEDEKDNEPDIQDGESTTVYEVVEKMPQFPGGDAALMEYVSSHLKYPVVAEENGIQGRVVCTFVVGRNGSITDVKVLKSADPSLDKEAVRLLRNMPRWQPGILKGKPVRVKYTVPVTFRLR